MSTQEVFRNDWSNFFHGFSSSHQGWLATIEVLGSELGAQIEGRELPFVGITTESTEPGQDRIALMFGRTPDEHLTHTITGPAHVRLDQAAEGDNETLQIESDGDTTTLVRFRSPSMPDLVPGIILE
jgi:hypothetical protein